MHLEYQNIMALRVSLLSLLVLATHSIFVSSCLWQRFANIHSCPRKPASYIISIYFNDAVRSFIFIVITNLSSSSNCRIVGHQHHDVTSRHIMSCHIPSYYRKTYPLTYFASCYICTCLVKKWPWTTQINGFCVFCLFRLENQEFINCLQDAMNLQ